MSIRSSFSDSSPERYSYRRDVPPRTVRLEGHESEVMTCDFSPEGDILASGGRDGTLFLWRLFPENENSFFIEFDDEDDPFGNDKILKKRRTSGLEYTENGNAIGEPYITARLKNHNALIDCCWLETNRQLVLTVGSTSTKYPVNCALWDVEGGVRLKNLKGHSGVVNSCHARGSQAVTGGDDGTVKLWDFRMSRRTAATFDHSYQVLSVVLDNQSTRIFAGTLDNQIIQLDLRNLSKLLDYRDNSTRGSHPSSVKICPVPESSSGFFPYHDDCVTGLSISNSGNILLSSSMDYSIRSWDVENHCFGSSGGGIDTIPSSRLLHVIPEAISHDASKSLLNVCWTPDDKFFTAATANGDSVRVWESKTMQIAVSLDGHSGCVNRTTFSPVYRPGSYILATASIDRSILVSELLV